MAKVTAISEHFQHFLAEMKESFGGICSRRRSWPGTVFRGAIGAAAGPVRATSATSGGGTGAPRYRNGYYEREFVTRFGTIRLRIARTREKSFLPADWGGFKRRAEEVRC